MGSVECAALSSYVPAGVATLYRYLARITKDTNVPNGSPLPLWPAFKAFKVFFPPNLKPVAVAALYVSS